MDYAVLVETSSNGRRFTYTDYRNLKRKPPKVETKPETKSETGAKSKECLSLIGIIVSYF
jgi:hypothetical protein